MSPVVCEQEMKRVVIDHPSGVVLRCNMYNGFPATLYSWWQCPTDVCSDTTSNNWCTPRGCKCTKVFKAEGIRFMTANGKLT